MTKRRFRIERYSYGWQFEVSYEDCEDAVRHYGNRRKEWRDEGSPGMLRLIIIEPLGSEEQLLVDSS